MTSRILPPEEYDRLIGTEAESVRGQLPSAARVVVVEDEGEIVGCHVLLPMLHAECLWVHPAHRGKSSVARRLWAAVKRTCREQFQADRFATAAVSADVCRLLAHVGAHRLPGAHFVVSVKGGG